MKDLEEIARDVFTRKRELIDLFCKAFVATEVRDLETFRSGNLLLVETEGGRAYQCHFLLDAEVQREKERQIERRVTSIINGELKSKISHIVALLIEDMSDRGYIGNEWSRIDEDIKEEIKEEWEEIIASNI